MGSYPLANFNADSVFASLIQREPTMPIDKVMGKMEERRRKGGLKEKRKRGSTEGYLQERRNKEQKGFRKMEEKLC